jgi:hypothetical protein
MNCVHRLNLAIVENYAEYLVIAGLLKFALMPTIVRKRDVPKIQIVQGIMNALGMIIALINSVMTKKIVKTQQNMTVSMIDATKLNA